MTIAVVAVVILMVSALARSCGPEGIPSLIFASTCQTVLVRNCGLGLGGPRGIG